MKEYSPAGMRYVSNENLKIMIYDVFEKPYDIHYFNIDDSIKKLLINTNFNYNKIHLPFNHIRLNISYTDKFDFSYPHIYVNENENYILINYARTRRDGVVSIGCLEFNKDLTSKNCFKDKKLPYDTLEYSPLIGDVSKLSNKEKMELYKKSMEEQGENPKEQTDATEESENLMVKFIGNFVNLLNSRDVELVTVERSKEQNVKRIARGKLPIPSTIFIRLKGAIKEYINKLNSSGEINYSHSFWVRGHWRTLRNERRYGDKIGTMIWILPYIKGQGDIVNKVYNVKK